MTALTPEKRIRLMTVRQLSERISWAESYLHDISPRASRYASLVAELRILHKRYRELTDPQLDV